MSLNRYHADGTHCRQNYAVQRIFCKFLLVWLFRTDLDKMLALASRREVVDSNPGRVTCLPFILLGQHWVIPVVSYVGKTIIRVFERLHFYCLLLQI